MRNAVRVLWIVICAVVLSTCSGEPPEQDGGYGSFTTESAVSFDGKYTADIAEDGEMIEIRITDSDAGEVFRFDPVRKVDFWGICWEADTYDLWILSGDVGVICWRYEDGSWFYDPEAVRPEYIHAKYDS